MCGERAFAEQEVSLTERGREGDPGSRWRGAAGGEAARGAGGRARRRDARPGARPQPLPHSGAPRSSPPGPSHSSPSGDARPGVKLVPQPLEGAGGHARGSERGSSTRSPVSPRAAAPPRDSRPRPPPSPARAAQGAKPRPLPPEPKDWQFLSPPGPRELVEAQREDKLGHEGCMQVRVRRTGAPGTS